MQRVMRMVGTTVVAALLVAPAAAAQTADSGALLDPNTATVAQLTSVPHVSPEIAKEITARRPFKNVTDLDTLLKAQKLSAAQLKEVYGKMFIPIDLNTATDGQILLIPGVGKRMLHEFKEYRPYKSIAQFRREIGKYVSKDEVARFERYVRIGE